MTHASMQPGTPADLIGSAWRELSSGGIISTSPAEPGRVIWEGAPRAPHVDDAIAAAREALPAWSRWPIDKREAVLRCYQSIVKDRLEQIAGLIADETGKVLWESRQEAGLLASKVDITLEQGEFSGRHRVTPYDVPLNDTKGGKCWYRPHGVMSVVGPFNFPAHLPNGHIVPALLTGNTIVFKPSDKAPAVGQMLASLFQEALDAEGAPPGVFNLVHGRGDIAGKLVAHHDVDGVLFTGSWPVGRKILEANLDQPGKIIALEMGGNNAAVVMPDADLHQAAIEIVRCAFNTAGQRCTCTRRAVIHESVADRLIPAIIKAASTLIVGHPRAEHPVFMGPIISEDARTAVFDAERRMAKTGGDVLLETTSIPDPIGANPSGWYLTPSILRVPRFDIDTDDAGCDREVFGPLLRIATVSSLDEAIEQANATRYGLAASIFTKDQAAIERFMGEARAGCVNVNCGTAGASSKLPFGGLGWSGNHRPAGAFSLDYTAIPIAGMVETGDAAALAPGMAFDRSWL
ncbi:MAG: aldehyde dehydrogenase family protein [Phycisphaerales bacterium]